MFDVMIPTSTASRILHSTVGDIYQTLLALLKRTMESVVGELGVCWHDCFVTEFAALRFDHCTSLNDGGRSGGPSSASGHEAAGSET